MQKSIFLVPYVNEAGIEAGGDLLEGTQIDISNRKIIILFVYVIFKKPSIF